MDTICALIFFIIVFSCIHYLLNDSSSARLINQIPGPKPIPFFGNFFDEFTHRTDIIWKIVERNKKYSTIYRIWHGPIPIVYASSPNIFEKILGSGSSHISKGFFYKFLRPWLGNGLLTSDGRKWFAHRKMLTPAFHQRILYNYVKVFQDNARILMGNLMGKAENGDVFDVYPLISLCTLDIICEAAMGIKINAQSHNKSSYADSVYRILHLTKERFRKFWLFPDFLYFATRDGKDYKTQIEILHKFTKGIIEERKTLRKSRKESLIPPEDLDIGLTKKTTAFLDLLLRQAQNKQVSFINDNDIREEVDTFAFEGHETTAVAICWTLLLLGWNEDIQEKAYREQIEIFGEGETRAPTMKDLTEMKFLERIIKETSRMYPSIPLVARIPDEDIRCDKYIIPKGTTVILDIYNLHRNPSIYPDPDKFDPDRFLLENSRNRHPYAHVPFSAGARNCIGQKFAMLEEKMILSTFLRHYKVVSMQERSEIKLVHELLLKPGEGAKVRIYRRSDMAIS